MLRVLFNCGPNYPRVVILVHLSFEVEDIDLLPMLRLLSGTVFITCTRGLPLQGCPMSSRDSGAFCNVPCISKFAKSLKIQIRRDVEVVIYRRIYCSSRTAVFIVKRRLQADKLCHLQEKQMPH